MAFAWSALGAGSPIENEDYNEIKTNLDTVYTLWVFRVPGAPVLDGQYCRSRTEMPSHPRKPTDTDVTDYADNNWCPTHNITHNASVYTSQNTTYNATNNATVDAADNAAVYTGRTRGITPLITPPLILPTSRTI
jgi:hypothetical protein